ncbi:MAG: ABC transporter substrate-binding protein [Deltaproteobacteria bacterium]|nr:ABC transporter substrate-binding protein [Deltaproteobacteria bacterium]MCL5792078.1 ABC transporter substrate-binding protein [Deltaproteobacteria bacterium]
MKRVFANILILLALLGGCNFRKYSSLPKNMLVTAVISDPKTFNPIVANETSSTDVLDPVFIGLTRLNPFTLRVEPQLASSWTISSDKRIITMNLKHNLYFSNGKPLTADDVVFTFKVIYSPDVLSSYGDIFTIKGKQIKVEKINKYTVEFILPAPFYPFLESLGGLPILPANILEKPLSADLFEKTWNINTPPEDIIGAGPYVINTYVPSQYIIFKRNIHYYAKDQKGVHLPYINTRVILIVPDQDTQYLKFVTGETDIYAPRTDEVARLEQMSTKKHFTVKNIGLDTGILFLSFNRNKRHYTKDGKINPKYEWFTNIDFLKAIAHSIDKQGIINDVYRGYGEPAVSFIPRNVPVYHLNMPDYNYDLSRAAALLKKAGFYLKDGKLYDKHGNRVEFDFFTNSGNQQRESVASIILENITRLGIKVNYKPLDFNTLVEKLTTNFDWDCALIALTGGYEPHDGANVLMSNGMLHIWDPREKTPATPWEKEIDTLMNKGAESYNIEKRATYYKKVQLILHKELPIIPIVRQEDFVAYTDRLENYRPTVFGNYRSEMMRLKQ